MIVSSDCHFTRLNSLRVGGGGRVTNFLSFVARRSTTMMRDCKPPVETSNKQRFASISRQKLYIHVGECSRRFVSSYYYYSALSRWSSVYVSIAITVSTSSSTFNHLVQVNRLFIFIDPIISGINATIIIFKSLCVAAAWVVLQAN